MANSSDRWLAPFLRNEIVYRTPPRNPGSAVLASGFMLKPDNRGGYRQRVLDELVVVYVLRGSGVFEDWTGDSHTVDAGCLIVLPPGRMHGVSQHPNGLWAEAYVLLSADAAEGFSRFGLIQPDHCILRPGVHRVLVEQFDGILDDLKHAPDRRLGRTLVRVHELLMHAHELDQEGASVDASADLIDDACALLSQNLDRRISVPALARQFDLSYERFRKLFRHRMGLSPGEYRIRRRIDLAQTLLAQARLSVSQVAYRLGYKDPFTFSKQFKRVTGISPQAFRTTT